jgi:hypothetical protein
MSFSRFGDFPGGLGTQPTVVLVAEVYYRGKTGTEPVKAWCMGGRPEKATESFLVSTSERHTAQA